VVKQPTFASILSLAALNVVKGWRYAKKAGCTRRSRRKQAGKWERKHVQSMFGCGREVVYLCVSVSYSMYEPSSATMWFKHSTFTKQFLSLVQIIYALRYPCLSILSL